MMVTTETVKQIEKIVGTVNGQVVTIDKTILRSLLSEIKMLHIDLKDVDNKKVDLIQKLTMEFAMHSMADSIDELAQQDWTGMTPNDVLMISAQRLRSTIKERAMEAHTA